jgi:hypothetical protein
VRIRTGGLEDLDLVKPLWLAVHHRHTTSMPELGPYVDDATWWAARRALYAELPPHRYASPKPVLRHILP